MRVVTEHMGSVRSVALGVWIGTGSAAETHEQAGLSHLLEHMLFRGTPSHTSLEIDQLFDGMGAEVNAGTGRETTSVYSRVLDTHVEQAFTAIAEMVFDPNLDEADLDSEREIVLEEIAMYEDDAQEKVFDVLGEAIFGSHPFGRPIIGRAEVVETVKASELRRFHDERYVGQNVVVAAAGAVDHDRIVELVAATGAAAGTPQKPESPASDHAPRRMFFEKDTEQYHVCLGAPGIDRHDDRRFALRVLDTIFGAAGSSRLFQEVREKRGLAYSVSSFSSLYSHTGAVGIYVGTRPDNVEEALSVISAEIDRLRIDPASEEELALAKENAKGRMLLSLESTNARMNRLGSNLLADAPILTVDEMEQRFDAVTIDDLRALAEELYDPARLSAACVGADEALYRRALAPLSEKLAA
ncbi:MAG TPA: pitrilysin family protein [Baekduia sp.]|nr:pitrilysin family protein [Baekduia sp.]